MQRRSSFLLKIPCAVLAALLALSALCAVGCAAEDGSVSVAHIRNIPAVFIDTSAEGLAGDAACTDTLIYTYDTADHVTVAIERGAECIELSEPTLTRSGTVSTATYRVEAVALGEYRLRFYANGEEDGFLDLAVRPAYPEDPQFDALESGGNRYFGVNGNTNTGTNDANVHDPVVVEANGKFYSFSTDNAGEYGYQVRESEDLIHWEYVGTAIRGCGNAETAPQIYARGDGGLQEVYELLSANPGFDCYTLWAPEVVRAYGGGWWLYGSWTTTFGSDRSVIFQCYADEVTGPYRYTGVVVCSRGQTGAPNAIDASVFTDAQGGLYMSYGSFFGGIWCLPLDPHTGLRADGITAEQMRTENLSNATLFGTRLAQGSVEGSVLTYREEVPVYDGSFTEYSSSALTTRSGYWMLCSAGSLSSDYNMRSVYAETLAGFNGVSPATAGSRVGGSFSWKGSAQAAEPAYDWYLPGHNDILTTSDGVDVLAYHDRIYFGNAGYHYLFVSMFAFNSQGEIVMSPNRYAGEALRPVTAAEITELSGGEYDYCLVQGNTPASNSNGGYASAGLRFESGGGAGNGRVTLNGERIGEWYLYGENWVSARIDLGGGTQTYYGVAMPAWIDAADRGGITLSFLREDGQATLLCNQHFGAQAAAQ